MAGEVIQTPTQAAAPPFQVINPSGISGGESLNTLTQVGEGNRNRAAQQQMQQQQMQMQQQQLAAQQQEAAADRALQERQLKDQEFHRQRSEKLSTIYSDGQMEIDRINDQIQEALRNDMDEDVQVLVAQKREIEARRAETGNKLNGLEFLNAAYGGLLSTQIGPDGKSAGAAMVRGMLNKANGARMVYDSAQRELVPIIERLDQEDLLPTHTPSEMGGEELNMDLNTDAGRVSMMARAKEREEKGLIPEQEWKKGTHPLDPPWPILQDKKANEPMGPSSELGVKPSGRWQELVEKLAIHAHGQADPQEVRVKLGNMFDSLEAGTRKGASPEEREAHANNAKDAYLAAKKLGMDAETLDKLLYMVSMKTRAADVAPALEAADRLEKNAQGQKPVQGQTKVGGKLSTLGRMITLLESRNEETTDATGKRTYTQVMKSWGDSPFFDFKTGEKKQGVESLIMDTITTLSRASRPEDVIMALTDSNPDNDPQGFEFLKTMHPEMREVILKELGYQAQEIMNVRRDKGVTGELSELEGVSDSAKEMERQLGLANQNIEMVQKGVKGSKNRKSIVEEGTRKRDKVTEEVKKKRDAVKSGPDYLLE